MIRRDRKRAVIAPQEMEVSVSRVCDSGADPQSRFPSYELDPFFDLEGRDCRVGQQICLHLVGGLFQYFARVALSPKLAFHWILLSSVGARESCWEDFVDSAEPPVIDASGRSEHRRSGLDSGMMEEKVSILRFEDVFVDVAATVQ